jgi:hypothetical protein
MAKTRLVSMTTEIITKSARSAGAKRMWERRRMQQANQETVRNEIIVRKVDWHLLFSAASIIVTLGGIIMGCYLSLRSDIGDVGKEIIKIETALILKGVAPAELFAKDK